MSTAIDITKRLELGRAMAATLRDLARNKAQVEDRRAREAAALGEHTRFRAAKHLANCVDLGRMAELFHLISEQ